MTPGDSEHAAFMNSELAAELYVDDQVDGAGRFYEVDSTLSMSALPDAGRFVSVREVIRNEYRRFLNIRSDHGQR